MKYTLLQLTQSILSSMDSDEVTSINDTTESLQVANVIRTAYYDLVNQVDLPEDYTVFNLTETSVASPVKMTLPATFSNFKSLRYNTVVLGETDPLWTVMKPMALEDFLDYTYQLKVSESNVETFSITTVSGNTLPIIYRNDQAPQYYTSFDDNTVIFDSYDSAVETYLKSLKTLAYGKQVRTFTMSDAFTPSLDEEQFALLLAEAKALAWAELKQTVHSKAEQSARRQKVAQQYHKRAIRSLSDLDQLINFGRR